MSKGNNNKPSDNQSASTLKNLFNRSTQQPKQPSQSGSVRSSGQKMTGDQLKEYIQRLSEQRNGAQVQPETTDAQFYGCQDPQDHFEQYDHEDSQGYGEQQFGYEDAYGYNKLQSGYRPIEEDYEEEYPDSLNYSDDQDEAVFNEVPAGIQAENQAETVSKQESDAAAEKHGEDVSDEDESVMFAEAPAVGKSNDKKSEDKKGNFFGRIKSGFGRLLNAMKQQPEPEDPEDEEPDLDDYELVEEETEPADSGIRDRYKSDAPEQECEEKQPAKLPKFLSRLSIEEYDDYNEDGGYITDYEDDIISRLFRKKTKPEPQNAAVSPQNEVQAQPENAVPTAADVNEPVPEPIKEEIEAVDVQQTDAEQNDNSGQIFVMTDEKEPEQSHQKAFEFAEPEYQRHGFNTAMYNETQTAEPEEDEAPVKIFRREKSEKEDNIHTYNTEPDVDTSAENQPETEQDDNGKESIVPEQAQLIYSQDDEVVHEKNEQLTAQPETDTFTNESADEQDVGKHNIEQDIPEKTTADAVKVKNFTEKTTPVAIYQSKESKVAGSSVPVSHGGTKATENAENPPVSAPKEHARAEKANDSRKKRELPAFDIFAEFAKEQKESSEKAATSEQPDVKKTETIEGPEAAPRDDIPADAKPDKEFSASEASEATITDVKEESFTDVRDENEEPVQPVAEQLTETEDMAAEISDEETAADDHSAKENTPVQISDAEWAPFTADKKAPEAPPVQAFYVSKNQSREPENPPQEIIFNSRWNPQPKKQRIPLDVDQGVIYEPAQEKPDLNERDLTEVGVTTVTYHYPSNEAFIVLAGKFTKTVRGEYEALRELRREAAEKRAMAEEAAKADEENKPDKPDKPTPANVPMPEKKSAPKPVVSAEKPKPADAAKVKDKDKKESRVDKAAAESKTTTASRLRSMFGKPDKKTALHSSADKNESTGQKSTLEDVIRDVEPKVEILPETKYSGSRTEDKKAEKRSARQKAAKAKQEKQKIRLSELFTNEEEFDPDDIVTEKKTVPKPLLDDYTEESDAEAIKTEIATNLQGVFARTIALAAATVASVMLSLIGQCTNLFNDTVRNGWLWFAIISFIIFGISVIVARNPIVNGLLPLRHFKGNSDTAVAVAALAAAMQNIAAIFTPDVFIDGSLFIYTPLVILGLFLNSIGKLLIITRTLYNFNFLVKPFPKFAGKIYTDRENAQAMISDLPVQSAIIGYMCRSKFMSNFLQLSYAPDPSEKLASTIAPWTTAFSLLCGILYGIISQSFTAALSSFALTACMSIPMICLLAVNIPMKRLCASTLRSGAMITGCETVTQFADTNAIMIDSSQLYPAGSVTLSGMKAFKQSMLNDALLAGAAIMYKVNGTMTHVFENIVQCSRDQLPKVDSVYYEDNMGLSAWIKGQRVLIGNRQILTNHKITPPDIEVEERHRRMGNDVMYISIGGDLIAMFILSYKTTKNVANELHELEQNGVSFIIRTVDPNITRETVADRFGLFHRCITVLPTNLGTVCHSVTSKLLDRSRAYLVTRGKISSFAKAVSGCIKMKSNMTLSRILQCIGLALGLITITLISFVSGFEKLGCLEMLIYIGFWSVATLIASVIRK